MQNLQTFCDPNNLPIIVSTWQDFFPEKNDSTVTHQFDSVYRVIILDVLKSISLFHPRAHETTSARISLSLTVSRERTGLQIWICWVDPVNGTYKRYDMISSIFRIDGLP